MSEFATNVGLVSGGLLLLTWVGYPVIMEVLARFRRAAVIAPDAARGPQVSVIIATRGPAELVSRRIADIRRTAYPADRYEIVIGQDSASPETISEFAQEGSPRITVVRSTEAPGKPGAINAAVALARGEILVLTDSAQTFEPDTIGALVARFADDRTGAVSGQLSLGSTASGRLIHWYWRMERRLRANEARVHSSVGVTGAVYAARRERFPVIPPDVLLDDLYVPMRMVLSGSRVDFTDRARAVDERAFSVAAEGRRKERTLSGVIQMCALEPAVLNPFRNPIWAQFVLHKVLRLATPLLILAMLPGLAVMVLSMQRGLSPGASRMTWGGVALAAVITLALPRSRELLREFVEMNVAVLRALRRGVRRDWDVW